VRVDFLATEPQFLDHLLPIWRALSMDSRGELVMPSFLAPYYRRRGLRRGSRPTGAAMLVASWGDHKKARKMGARRIARIEHGIGQSFGTGHPSYAGGMHCEDVELFLVPNEYSARLWGDAYPNAQVAIVGCPKLDALPAYAPTDPPTVAVSFHWKGQTVPEAGSAFADFAAAVLDLRDRDYRVVMHCHPKVQAEIRRWAARNRLPFVADFDEVLRTAALYACDGVSTLYEFAATGRPVVVLNAAAYRPHVSHGLRFWDAADVGVQVNPHDELAAAIDLALQDRPIQQRNRERALRMVYGHRTGAAKRTAKVLTRWAKAIPGAALFVPAQVEQQIREAVA
jgi:hypothetical protein